MITPFYHLVLGERFVPYMSAQDTGTCGFRDPPFRSGHLLTAIFPGRNPRKGRGSGGVSAYDRRVAAAVALNLEYDHAGCGYSYIAGSNPSSWGLFSLSQIPGSCESLCVQNQ